MNSRKSRAYLKACFCNALSGTLEKRTNAKTFCLKLVHGMLQGYYHPAARLSGRPDLESPDR